VYRRRRRWCADDEAFDQVECLFQLLLGVDPSSYIVCQEKAVVRLHVLGDDLDVTVHDDGSHLRLKFV
jgi:hypothetical protein